MSETNGGTVTVQVWQGRRTQKYETLLEQEPEEYELSVAATEFGRVFELDDAEMDVLSEDIEHHGTYAFNVPNSERPITLNIHTNDSYHNPEDWSEPIEQGLTFHDPDKREPFKTELWGRLVIWVERPGQPDAQSKRAHSECPNSGQAEGGVQ